MDILRVCFEKFRFLQNLTGGLGGNSTNFHRLCPVV
jgi:hypothetical protein